jgi:hypothetical protein
MRDEKGDRTELTPRQLDVAVAERLFGWTETKLWEGGACVGVPPDRKTIFDIPRYSGGWAGAGLVMDALAGRDWLVSVENHRAGVWVAKVMGPTTPEFAASSPNVGLAVCHAALQALGAAKEAKPT